MFRSRLRHCLFDFDSGKQEMAQGGEQ